jgi:hypothetical protein
MTKEIIEAAIAGFEGQKKRIDAQIAELRAMLTGTATGAAPTGSTKGSRGGRRKFSAAALRNMRKAQKQRWAKAKGATPTTVEAKAPAKPKRKMSAAGRKAIAAAQKKRWAAKKAAAVK